MKNYLFVIDRIENGGAERQLLKIAGYLPENINVFITSLHIPSSALLLSIKEAGFTYISISTSSGIRFYQRFFSVLNLIRALKKLLVSYQIDRCVSFLEWSNILTIIAVKNKAIPVCINVRNHLSTQYGIRSPLVLKLAKLIVERYYPKAERILCNSYGIKTDLVEAFNIPNDLIDVIQNTYSINVIRENVRTFDVAKSQDSSTVFCACGRLSDQKRFESLVLSFQEYIKKSKRNDSLLIIGSGSNENAIKKLIQEGNADIKLHPHQDNPFPNIAACDCFILHSEFEGFPNVLAEALILGNDCISVDCLTGPREVLSGNVMIDYKTPINALKVLDYGLLYPYKKMSIGVDDGLVNALNIYSKGGYMFNKNDYDFLCETEGKRKWLKVL